MVHPCWQPHCTQLAQPGHGGRWGQTGVRPFSEERVVRKTFLTASVTLALVLVGFVVGGANDVSAGASSAKADRDETIMTVQVSSADHEIQEGYFTLGDS